MGEGKTGKWVDILHLIIKIDNIYVFARIYTHSVHLYQTIASLLCKQQKPQRLDMLVLNIVHAFKSDKNK